jgi:16S rRNA processing protein RimM
VIALEGEISEKIKEMESVFVEIDGRPVPFFFEYVNNTSPNTLVAKFDYYDSDSSVAEFVSCRVFSDNETLITYSDSKLPIYLNGYLLLDSDRREIGEIHKVLSFPRQVMLELRNARSEEILIPYSEDMILEVDDLNKILVLDLPEGIDSINT